MRLAIYDNCTVLSLLILTHTCRTFYLDINTCSRLVIRSDGYTDYTKRPNTATHPHPLLSSSAVPLTIWMMLYHDTLDDLDEMWLFNRLYSHPQQSSSRIGWWKCGGWGEIVCRYST
ncbi:hypothetical protein BJ508DRAFT_335263 [Ascobolus immersus RN42]|uniref:F-box domain-containing protein n=1 Tax=Ascobolus immersus RN42 TaxID=1160509 RepID=A0A3N4HD54_ASCIM|nr:hypothetical protein BJ508DRAFT_335263 [Ascobolus immersus RN42]